MRRPLVTVLPELRPCGHCDQAVERAWVTEVVYAVFRRRSVYGPQRIFAPVPHNGPCGLPCCGGGSVPVGADPASYHSIGCDACGGAWQEQAREHARTWEARDHTLWELAQSTRRLRLDLGLDLRRAARALGITPAQLSGLEHGRADLSEADWAVVERAYRDLKPENAGEVRHG
jgi:hypothetical protein